MSPVNIVERITLRGMAPTPSYATEIIAWPRVRIDRYGRAVWLSHKAQKMTYAKVQKPAWPRAASSRS